MDVNISENYLTIKEVWEQHLIH